MTKSELIQRVAYGQTPLTTRDVELAVNVMLEHMAACLAAGGRIEIRGFGTFSLRYRPARLARNPRTEAAISLPARYAPHFKPGKALRERVDRPIPDARGDSGGGHMVLREARISCRNYAVTISRPQRLSMGHCTLARVESRARALGDTQYWGTAGLRRGLNRNASATLSDTLAAF